MKNLVLIIASITLLIISCKNNKTVKKEQIKRKTYTKELSFFTDTSNLDILVLNDKAIEYLLESKRIYDDLKYKDSLLKESLKYLDLAIQKDSNFYNAYLNKSAVLRELKKYGESIKPLDELLKRKKHPEAIFIKGLIYEKTGNKFLAEKKYKEAYKVYEEYLKTPLSTERDKMNKDYVLLFLEGKNKILMDIEQKLKSDPNNTSLLIDKNIIEQFDREEFINSF